MKKPVPFSTNNEPLPRTALEPVCEGLADVIRQRREASGLSLNRLAELAGGRGPGEATVEQEPCRIVVLADCVKAGRANNLEPLWSLQFGRELGEIKKRSHQAKQLENVTLSTFWK